jgi:hypothetical protein
MFELDQTGIIKTVSPNVKDVYSLEPKEFLGKKYEETMEDDTRNSISFHKQTIKEYKCNIIIEYAI